MLVKDVFFVLFSIIFQVHWLLIVVYPKAGRVRLFDSLKGPGKRHLDAVILYVWNSFRFSLLLWLHHCFLCVLKRFLKYFQEEHDQEGPSITWSCESNPSNMPLQKNSIDCGAFMCMYARDILFNQVKLESACLQLVSAWFKSECMWLYTKLQEWTFTQLDVPKFRKDLLHMIVHGQLRWSSTEC